jgi:hypothetical protein
MTGDLVGHDVSDLLPLDGLNHLGGLPFLPLLHLLLDDHLFLHLVMVPSLRILW